MDLQHYIDDAVMPNITAERLAHNAKLAPPPNVAPGAPSAPSPDEIPTNEAFVKWKLDEFVRECVGRHKLLPPAPPPPPAVPIEITIRQAHDELFALGLYHPFDAALSEVDKCIARIADMGMRAHMHNLFYKSNVFERNRPEVISMWTTPAPDGFGRTLEQLDAAFVSGSKR